MVIHTRSRSRRDVHDDHDTHTPGAVDPAILTADPGSWAGSNRMDRSRSRLTPLSRTSIDHSLLCSSSLLH